jgi:hypothetical protein
MIILVKKTNQKNHVSFMHHGFNENEHPFGQCGHFSQVELSEKPLFLVMSSRVCWYSLLQ